LREAAVRGQQLQIRAQRRRQEPARRVRAPGDEIGHVSLSRERAFRLVAGGGKRRELPRRQLGGAHRLHVVQKRQRPRRDVIDLVAQSLLAPPLLFLHELGIERHLGIKQSADHPLARLRHHH
jgi:hypothetical protein